VSGSALTLGFGATDRADKLFECLTPARLVLKVFALQRESTRNGPHESRQKRVPYLWDALSTRLGPLQWDLVESDAGQSLANEGRRYTTPLHTVAWGGAEDSSGTDVFSQALTEKSGLCTSPVFAMMLQFLSLVRDQKAQVAVVAPRWDESVPRGIWWPLWMEFATGRVLSSTRGTIGVFVEQTMHGEWEPARPVPCDVWGICFRCA
jgi:hypothetical protein